MKAVVLVGGRGTRMRPLTFAVPKPLLAVGQKPILHLNLEQLKRAGFDDIVLATGYLAELIESFCGDGSRFGVRITYVREEQPLGTAGPLSLLRHAISPDEFFLLMNGDVVSTLDLAGLLNFCRKQDYDLAVAYVQHTYQSPYGVLTIENGEVVNVVEKPELRQPISSGIYALKGSALDCIPDGQFFTIPDLIHKLRALGRRVGAYPIKGLWVGIENLDDIEKAISVFEQADRGDAAS
ncbi:MAG TPA: sugar phosphate nucleotidyltransferase [Terriglobia bacterium]|nr:sugar phosphate nucleotidyltransferase [Terriglobia bacterium]